MAAKHDDVFILGEEQLEPLAETPGAEEGGEPARPSARRPRLRLGRRSVASAALLAALLTSLFALLGGGESEPEPPARPPTPSAAPVVLPAPLKAKPRQPAARVPRAPKRVRRSVPTESASESAERKPITEVAPVSPPPVEPAPQPEVAAVPVSPPVAPSPSRPLREGSGARPEFGIER